MKILWVKTDYLHPTDRGGQIRTLEMLKRLHARHAVDYLTLADPNNTEGPVRAHEYCRRHFAVPHQLADKRSLAFAADLWRGLVTELPVSIGRWKSEAMRRKARELDAAERYDAIVCDFLMPVASLDDWPRLVLFQHNVEALLWERHVERAATPLHRWYLRNQATKMAALEQRASREFGRVICVSEQDAALTRDRYGRQDAAWVPTGVDTDYFTAPAAPPKPVAELIFLGSMDWMPNVEGAAWMAADILPLIWAKRPETTIALVGRRPDPKLQALAQDQRIKVSGTVDDVRPWLWGSAVSIVPLRIGGGTRLKIYEAMAAGVATVSTTIGAEGLDVRHEDNILLADSAEAFANACLRLLDQPAERERIAATALAEVRAKHGWEAVTRRFEELLVIAGRR
ncbi:MAG: glycosyltransferase [Bryobacterales bacterium]|nr:glycosyltransferase [Bryobacterales bacterium]